ncbi:interferon-induced very large GTPase 1-like, partial [Manacus vitellinus]|uniref:interferon-induced very large GTPase 1-like n=1 Tax=Manacus vitellinus TaxID=328815 RepID=UPI00115CDD0E
GPLHFGGIFWWKASTGGFRAEQREEMKRQTSEALNTFVGASFSGFGASAGGATDVSRSSSQASVQGRAGESSHTEIRCHVFTTGGPTESSSLPQWKTGLVSNNSTWCVIDRGSQLIPVWEVILCNHSRDFQSVHGMSRALRAAYKALTNQSVGSAFGEELASAVEEAREFMEIVKTWEGAVDEKKLLTLMELKQDLSAKTKDPRVWINVCLSDKALQDFLVNTVRSYQESPPENSTSIKAILRSLLDPHIYSVKDFPESSFIMQWIFQTDHRLPKTPNVSELEELLQTLQQTMEHIHAVTYAPGTSASAVQEAKREATLTTGLAIHSFLRSLQERAQKDMELLVLLIATSTGYQVGSSTFHHLLGHAEIQYLAQAMAAAHEQYVTLKEQDAARAEASLLLTALTVTPQSKELSPEQKRERLSQPADTKKYFLQWMKVFMDDLSSGHLEELRRDYHKLWSEILEKKKSKEKTNPNPELLSRLEALSDEINDSSVGLEHLLREVGQIYEALHLRNSKNENVVKLSQMAAELMVSGYPVELMDGDASYLPLHWVGAIFDSLIERLGDKRVFVLSVLGIQSTGKSTLLNAMFGLQFNVSAGRCTRGAFMQLLPLDEQLQEDVGFDYMLVVDTEGLRAIEMANKQSLNHDNELATFVIGIGNMTLINIFGENPSEMQDVLQIAVQALLRMKKVNLSPSCLFVHQNVGEVTAKEQNMEGQRRLQEKLDEMTVVAAQQECCDVSSFSDVIRFDVNTHIHYFAHLWEGNPPMAPPNPTYSHNVQQLKCKVLQAAKESQGSILTLSSLKVRIGDLWNALLNENFVFSFKNSLEIAVYRKLETAFSQWTWRLRSHILDVQMRLNNRIRNGDLQQVTTEHLEGLVQETSDAIVTDMEKYFREEKHREMLVQWKGSTELKLKELKENLLLETRKKCQNLIELQKTQSKVDARKSEYEDELLRKSRELALTLKGKSLSEIQLRDKFTSLWAEWITEVSRAAPPPERVDIDAEIEDVLLEHFKEPGFHARIRSFPKHRGFSLDLKKHVTKKKGWKTYLPWNVSNADVILQDITDNIIDRVWANIDKKEQEKRDYSRTFIHEILHEVQEGVNSVPSDAQFRVNKDYIIDLSLYLCRTAAERFKAMHKMFQKANDPVVYLNSKREDFFTCFQISCQGATSVTAFAVFLCDKLAPALRRAVYERTAKAIAGDMQGKVPDFQGNRANLDVCILRFLAQEENFQYFKQYLEHPKEFFQWYIERRVESYCLGESRRLEKFLDSSLDVLYGNILSAVASSTQRVKDRKD